MIDYILKGKMENIQVKGVKVHGNCKKVYTKERSIQAFQSRQNPKLFLRCQGSDLDFLYDCLVCGADASDEY